MQNPKQNVVTFKVDPTLADRMKTIPNRSEFIRHAVLEALDNTCPLCRGTGVLTPDQKEHWKDFEQAHTLQRCTSCREYHLVCENEKHFIEKGERK